MRNLITTILLILSFSIVSFAQTKTLDALEKENKSFKKNKCKITYDKFKDTALVSSSLGGTNLPLTTITATFSFKGQTLSEPIEFYVVSVTTNSIMKNTSLIFISNGERIKIGEALSENQSTTLMSAIDVYLHSYKFTPEQFEKFASSEKVEFQIGNLELIAQKGVSEKLKNLLTLAKLK